MLTVRAHFLRRQDRLLFFKNKRSSRMRHVQTSPSHYSVETKDNSCRFLHEWFRSDRNRKLARKTSQRDVGSDVAGFQLEQKSLNECEETFQHSHGLVAKLH